MKSIQELAREFSLGYLTKPEQHLPHTVKHIERERKIDIPVKIGICLLQKPHSNPYFTIGSVTRKTERKAIKAKKGL